MAICMVGLLWIFHVADPAWRPALALVLPVPFAEGSFVIRTLLLAAVNGFTVRPEPPVGDERPPIDVIIPAYNEEEVIGPTLEAIDMAAVPLRRPGAGGADERRVDRRYPPDCAGHHRRVPPRHRRGPRRPSRRQVGVAQRRPRPARSDIVVRIDADTVIGEWSLYYTPRWFEDPLIGLVEPMCFPGHRPRTVFPYMRLSEELKQFGLNHHTIQTVDGVNVVPGCSPPSAAVSASSSAGSPWG